MQAQRYRHRISFEEQTTLVDSTEGAREVHWIPVVLDSGEALEDVPAEVLTGPGREFVQSGKTQGEIAARINCGWFPGLLQGWRIVWEGQVFNIAGWELDRTARREYRIKVHRRVNDGQ